MFGRDFALVSCNDLLSRCGPLCHMFPPEPQADRRHTYFVYRNLPDSNQTQYPLPHDTGLYRKYTIEWYVLYSVLLFDRTPASGFPLTLVHTSSRRISLTNNGVRYGK